MPESPLPPPTETPSLNEDTSSKETRLDDAIQAEVAKLEGTDQTPPAAPGEGDKPAETTKPDDARLVQLAKQRRALEREKAKIAKEQADLRAKTEAAEKTAAEKAKQADELEALLKGLSTPEGLQAVLQKAGIDFNQLARAGIGLKPVQQDPGEKALAELEAVKKQLAEERAARAESERLANEAAQKQREEAGAKQAISAVTSHIQSKAAEYKHLADDGEKAVREVLKRSYTWLQENQEALGHPITDSEEIELVDFFCKEVESEYRASAVAIATRLQKLGIIPGGAMGINPNTGNAPAQSGAANELVSTPNADLDPESQAIISQYRANQGGNKLPQKFITNDSTLGPKPGTVAEGSNSARLTSDERLEKLIEQYR